MPDPAIFTQKDYNRIVDALDEAIQVFIDQGKDEDDAQAALKSFIDSHYFAVWRAING